MARNRYDETWHRLREWTKGQPVSERLAAQILIHEGFADVDPSHPLGGRDGGKDAIANRAGTRFVMAAYFPRGQQTFSAIQAKFESDLQGLPKNSARGIAFVTNQELLLSDREVLCSLAEPSIAEIYHLERITAVLDAPDMAMVREQFLEIAAADSPTIKLGGTGGSAPGAGGGGGGAMGSESKGGDGGRGGNINLAGQPGKAPGAGGGGAGAIGDGAIGGEGGGGGEILSVLFGPEEIGPGSGVHHFDIQVGKGGRNGPGEDTIINFCDESGNVLRSVIASGGKAGAPPIIPPRSRPPTQEEVDSGFKVTCVLAAEFIRIKNGFVTIVDGGWDLWTANSNPFQIVLPLLIEVTTGAVEPGAILDVSIVVLNPTGFQVHEQEQTITISDALVRRSRFGATLEFTGSLAGVWRIQVLAGGRVVGEFPIEIRISDAK